MAKKQVLPVIGSAAPPRPSLSPGSGGAGQKGAGSGIAPGRKTTSTPVPTAARMKAGKGISNGVKPGKQVVC